MLQSSTAEPVSDSVILYIQNWAYCCGLGRLLYLKTILWLPSSYPPEGNQCFVLTVALYCVDFSQL